jgi:hypothetical protein
MPIVVVAVPEALLVALPVAVVLLAQKEENVTIIRTEVIPSLSGAVIQSAVHIILHQRIHRQVVIANNENL